MALIICRHGRVSYDCRECHSDAPKALTDSRLAEAERLLRQAARWYPKQKPSCECHDCVTARAIDAFLANR